MSTAEHPAVATSLPPLVAGQRMGRVEFHERYEAIPPGTIFELIDGEVFMASPVGPRHGQQSFLFNGWLFHYMARTPGVVGYDNATVLIEDHEIQPDLFLRIAAGPLAQSRNIGTAISGSPELIVEVADSSRGIDLGKKLEAYDRSDCQEYVVFTLDSIDLHWHVRRDSRLTRVEPDEDGLFRSSAFPGLWLDRRAVVVGDILALLAALDRGLASPEHAAFVARLAGPEPA